VQGPIPLASKNYINGGKRGIVSGWGKIEKNNKNGSNVLRWISVNVLSQEDCLQFYKSTNKNQICTLKRFGIGVCQVSYFYTYFFILYIIHLMREHLSMHIH